MTTTKVVNTKWIRQ